MQPLLQGPTVYVIAGPNGAGKTAFARRFLPESVHCREFLNADLIAAGLSPFAPETQDRRAGRLVLERMRELAAARVSFGFETTLAGRTYARRLAELKAQGYRVALYFLWLPTADQAVERVAVRVSQGGHNVAEADVRRRFVSGIRNLRVLYGPLADTCWLYDASVMPPLLVALRMDGADIVVAADRFTDFQQAVEVDADG